MKKGKSTLTLAEERLSEAGSVMHEALQFPSSLDAPVAPCVVLFISFITARGALGESRVPRALRPALLTRTVYPQQLFPRGTFI